MISNFNKWGIVRSIRILYLLAVTTFYTRDVKAEMRHFISSTIVLFILTFPRIAKFYAVCLITGILNILLVFITSLAIIQV